MRYSVGQVQDNLWEVIQGSSNIITIFQTELPQQFKKREIFANCYKGNNPKDSIVRDLEYHDMFSAQRQNIAITLDCHRGMWYVVDQSVHPCIPATGDT